MNGEYDVSWDELLGHIDQAGKEIGALHSDIDTIVTISRGGLIPAALVSRILNVKKVYSFGLNYYNRENMLKKVPDVYQPLPDSFWSSNILLIDDVADSGSSLNHVLTYINRRYCTDQPVLTYTVYYKPKSSVAPNFFSKCIHNDIWINFPWEKKINTDFYVPPGGIGSRLGENRCPRCGGSSLASEICEKCNKL